MSSLSPLCLVSNDGDPFVGTTDGVDVDINVTISIKLDDPTNVTTWYLEVLGTDELSTDPTLIGVDSFSHIVDTPSTVVTYTSSAIEGAALRFRSTVEGPGGPLLTSFGIYTATPVGGRVGAVTEQREGNTSFGWITLINPVLRLGAAVLSYNDSLQIPASGANTIQGAIDWLKTQIGGGGGTLDGDVTGDSDDNTVEALGGNTLPDPLTATAGDTLQIAVGQQAFSTPLAVTTQGSNIWVASSYQGDPGEFSALTKVPAAGTFATEINALDNAFQVGVGLMVSDGTNLYVNDQYADEMVNYLPGSGIVETQSVPGNLRSLHYSASYIWMTVGGGSTGVYKVDPNNLATQTFVVGSDDVINTVYTASSNRIWGADGASLFRINPTSVAIDLTVVAGFVNPFYVIYSSVSDKLWVYDANGGSPVFRRCDPLTGAVELSVSDAYFASAQGVIYDATNDKIVLLTTDPGLARYHGLTGAFEQFFALP